MSLEYRVQDHLMALACRSTVMAITGVSEAQDRSRHWCIRSEGQVCRSTQWLVGKRGPGTLAGPWEHMTSGIKTASFYSGKLHSPVTVLRYWWPNPTQMMTRMDGKRTQIANETINLTMTRQSHCWSLRPKPTQALPGRWWQEWMGQGQPGIATATVKLTGQGLVPLSSRRVHSRRRNSNQIHLLIDQHQGICRQCTGKPREAQQVQRRSLTRRLVDTRRQQATTGKA